MKNQKVSFVEKLAFGIGDAGCNFVWTTVGSFLTLYYTDSVGLSAAVVGTMMLLTRILDGISDLAMGSIIDRTNTRWGKARPWVLWTALPMGIGMVLLFSVPSSLSQSGRTAYATVTYMLMAVVIYTACNLSYNTLLSLITSDSDDRVSMSSIRFFCTMGTVLIISYNTNSLVEAFGWLGMSVIYGILATLLLLVTFLGTKERNQPVVKKGEEKLSVTQSFKVLFKNKYFIFVTLLFVINYLALNVSNGIGIYYARDVLGNAGIFGTLTLCFILPKMVGNVALPKLTQKFGKWKLLIVGYILEIIGVALILAFSTNVPVILAGLVLKGIGGIPHTAGLFALVADVVDYGEWTTGQRIDGLTYSATSFGMKVGTGLGSAIVGWGLAFGKYDANLAQQATETIFAMKFLYAGVPLILFAIGLVIMYFTNLDKYAPKMKAELAVRRSEEQN